MTWYFHAILCPLAWLQLAFFSQSIPMGMTDQKLATFSTRQMQMQGHAEAGATVEGKAVAHAHLQQWRVPCQRRRVHMHRHVAQTHLSICIHMGKTTPLSHAQESNTQVHSTTWGLKLRGVCVRRWTHQGVPGHTQQCRSIRAPCAFWQADCTPLAFEDPGVHLGLEVEGGHVLGACGVVLAPEAFVFPTMPKSGKVNISINFGI
ncbi:hypothetical protein BJV74DRAFT_800262 [Russula compacta]|nr:hypothetical protein BJV74DRAFT_800262 [Russula compacta]